MKKENVAKKMVRPKLLIHSLHDAKASSSDGKWRYAATGERTHKEIRHEFNLAYPRAKNK